MKITQEADYAIRIVYYLAMNRQKIDARTISEGMQVTQRFALKILHKLCQQEYVRSYKGVHGGYELAKDPAAISLLDIIEAIDGPVCISRCEQDEYTCGRMGENKGACVFHCYFGRVSAELRRELGRATFAQAVSGHLGCCGASAGSKEED